MSLYILSSLIKNRITECVNSQTGANKMLQWKVSSHVAALKLTQTVTSLSHKFAAETVLKWKDRNFCPSQANVKRIQTSNRLKKHQRRGVLDSGGLMKENYYFFSVNFNCP